MKKLIFSLSVKAVTFVLLALCGIEIILNSSGVVITVLVGIIAVLSFPIASVLHESGHMLFGSFVKIKAIPDSKNFLSFILESLLDFGKPQSCKIIPKTDKNLRKALIVTAIGGIAVNMLFIVLGIIALCVPAVPTELCVLLPASFHLIAMNAMPFDFDNGKTDGRIVAELIKLTDSAKVTLAVLTVQAQILQGKKIEEIDENLLFGVPQIAEDDLSFISLTELRYEYFTAKGDSENAEKWKTRFEELKQQYMD